LLHPSKGGHFQASNCLRIEDEWDLKTGTTSVKLFCFQVLIEKRRGGVFKRNKKKNEGGLSGVSGGQNFRRGGDKGKKEYAGKTA